MKDGISTDARAVFDSEEAREIAQTGDQAPGMPRGLMLAVARDMHAMESYARMTEAERAAFLDCARSTPDGEPMQRLLRRLRGGDWKN